MKKTTSWLKGGLAAAQILSMLGFLATRAAAAALAPELQAQKNSLERTLEDRVRDALTSYLGRSNIIVVVNISWVMDDFRGDGKSAIEYALPGVPIDQGLTKKNTAAAESIRNADRTVSAVVFIGSALEQSKIEQAKQIASQILQVNPAKGDTLVFRAFEPSNRINNFLSRNGAMAVLVQILAIGSLLFFLFGPVRDFFDRLIEALGRRTAAEGGVGPVMSGAQAMAAAAAASSGAGGVGTGKGRHALDEEDAFFGFINEDNLSGLVQALAKENELLIASVLECLPRPLSAKAFSLFTPEKRREILIRSQDVKYGNPESIRLIEKQIRSKLGFSFGGVRKMARIIQRLNTKMRTSILDDLAKAEPALAQQMRSHIIEFKDIFEYDDRSFLRIFRELSLPTFARFLKASPPAWTERVCRKISPELAELLQEQIVFMPPVPPEAAEEEFIRIVDAVERLKTAGLLTVEKTPAVPAPAAAPAAAPARPPARPA